MSQNALTSMDLALRAVGRTVVNFQRLEHNLKLASRLGPLEGTLPQIQREIGKRVQRSATLTLGQAIQAWLAASDAELTETGYTSDLFDATMQMKVSLVPDAEARNAHGAALKSLLEARNRLVHGGLVHVPWHLPEECERLIAELEIVNNEIGAQIDFLTSIMSAFSKLAEVHSDDFKIVLAPRRITEDDG